MALVLTACASGAVHSEGAASVDPTLPSDPCSLVTVEEVEAATGSEVVRTGLVPDDRLHRPTDIPGWGPPRIFRTNPCEFVTDGMHASITVYVDPDGAADFAAERDTDPVNTEPIEGIGDEAFAHALASLHVRAGDGYFVLSTQHGAGWEGIEDLQDLARAALD